MNDNNVDLNERAYVRRGNKCSVDNKGEYSVYVKKYSSSDIILDVNSNADGVLALAEMYYPGWKVYIDGKETELLQVDYVLRGVNVLKEMHNVEFKYKPVSFLWEC